MVAYREGAFPFNWFSSGTPVSDTATPLGNGRPTVKVTAAVAITSTLVRVSFSEEVKHSNPANSDDALNPTNYVFSVVAGAPITAASVSLHQADPTIVDVVVNEMTNGASYNVEVSNVENLDGQVVDPAYDDQDFTGIGVAPQVSSATALTAFTVRIVFNEAMKNDVALTTPSNYNFTDGLAATLVERESATWVKVTVNEMVQSHSYTVTVTGVKDVADNPLDPAHDEATFGGIGEAPQLEDYIVPETDYLFYIFYNETVQPLEAEDKDNYTLVPDLGGIVSVTQVTGTKYLVETTNVQEVGVSYTLTVADVHDLAGNLIDPAHDSVTFAGHVETPPLLYLYPVDGTIDIQPRTYVRQQAVDPELLHSGIVLATWQVRATIGDSPTAFNVVVNGVLNTELFEGEIIGDPLDDTDGVTVSFRPKRGFWDPDTKVSIYAEVEDGEGNTTNQTWEISFGAFECFEDYPVSVAEDTTVLTEITRFPKCERLRKLFLASCSHSMQSIVQARTLLWFAASASMRTLVSILFNPKIVDSVKLCNRRHTLEVQIALSRDADTVRAALGELRSVVDAHTLHIVEDRLKSADAPQVVSAIAAIVVIAAHS